MKVQNLNGTGNKACSCGTWLEHWRRYNGVTSKIPPKCAAIDCDEPVGDGAHIKKSVMHDQRHFIVPLCKACNHRTDIFDIPDDTPLALANVAETCGG